MAINETVLGPNSSSFIWDASENTTSIMNAMDTYITSKGWELYDSAAPQGLTGTAPVGRVYRRLQDGSATIYKYVGIAMNTTALKFRIYSAWNPVAHTGTNEAGFYNSWTTLAIATNMVAQVGTANAGFVLFVNPLWLGVRTRNSAGVHSHFHGSFEMKNENAETAAVPRHCFLTSENGMNGPYSASGYVTVCQAVSDQNLTAVNATGRTSFSTVNGAFVNGYDGFVLNMTNPTFSGAATMTVIENNSETILLVRGRIIGVKQAFGPVFTDMDTASILCDANYMHDKNGSAVSHHYIISNSGTVQYYLPV